MKRFKFLTGLVLISVLLLFSCGIGNNEEQGTPSQEIKDRAYLIETYSPVQGTYSGTVDVMNSRIVFPVEISLFIVELENGVNENGEPHFLPVLKGRYRRLDRISEDSDQVLSVRFVRETGEIIASVSENGSGLYISINGYLRDGKINAKVTESRGVIGVLKADKISDEANAPYGDRDEERREHILKTYKIISGIYEGFLTPASENLESFPVEINIFFVEEQHGTNDYGEPRLFPTLRARYRRLDIPVGITNSELIVRYFPDTGLISMKEKAAGMSGGREKPLSITGEINIDKTSDDEVSTTMVATVTESRGVLGEVNLLRTSVTAGVPEDDSETEDRKLLEKVLGPLTGVYTGEVKNSLVVNENGNEEFQDYPVEIKIFMVQQRSGTNDHGEPIFLPALYARLKRLNSNLLSLNYLLAVRYYPLTDKIVMRNVAGPRSSGSVPGVGLFSFEGLYDKNKKRIFGNIADHRGDGGGTMDVKKK